MSSQKLHVLPGCPRCSTVMITAALVNEKLDLVHQTRESLRTDEYRKLNPVGVAPTLETSEGVIYQSGAISRYFARKNNALYGKDATEQALVDQWIDTLRTDIAPAGKFLMVLFGAPTTGIVDSFEDFNQKLAEYVKNLKWVDEKLAGKKYLVGDALTLADIVAVSDLSSLYRFVFTEKERKALPNLSAYFDSLVKTQAFATVLGKFVVPEHHLNFEMTQSDNKKVDKKNEKKANKPAEKKEEKKPAKKAEKKEDNDEEDDQVQEEKPKEYEFPKSDFNFMNFKTLYVNEPDKQKALDELWKNWDEKAFSFWHLRYDKLESECKKIYLTNNLMGGFLDRADTSRKHALGVHGVYGDEPELEVRGVWLWRGTDMLPTLKEHPQFDIYQYKKLDPNVAEDKALITEYWTKMNEDTDKVEGLTVRTLKFFK